MAAVLCRVVELLRSMCTDRICTGTGGSDPHPAIPKSYTKKIDGRKKPGARGAEGLAGRETHRVLKNSSKLGSLSRLALPLRALVRCALRPESVRVLSRLQGVGSDDG